MKIFFFFDLFFHEKIISCSVVSLTIHYILNCIILNYNNCKKYTIYIQQFSNYYNIYYFDEVYSYFNYVI